MEKFFLISIIFILIGCNVKEITDEGSSTLPNLIYQNTEINIYVVKDSISIDTDSLFFHVDFFLEDLSVKKGFVKINNGVGKVRIPSDAAYFFGYFYSLEDTDTVVYERIIHNSKGKPALNSYQLHTTEDRLESELRNYPNNITAYANHISYLASEYYKGKINDTLYNTKVLIYLDSAKSKFNSEKISHISAMARLYARAKEYRNSQSHILDLLNKYPNSNFLSQSIGDYTYTFEFGEVKNSEELFFDSLMKQISDKYPHSSTGMKYSQGYYDFVSKDYKDRDIIHNNIYWMNNIDSSRIDFISPSVNAYVHLKEYDSAIFLAKKLLEKAKNNYGRHKNPMLTKQDMKKMGYKQRNGFIADAYALMSDIEIAKENYQRAIQVIDMSIFYFRRDTVNKYSNNSINYLLTTKASIQKKINNHSEALKIYDTLYQETKDDRVLDSIKILFKETEQEKGFESYAKNLKERVENENAEPKKLAAGFSIKDMSGYEIKLSEWKGRVVVLNFWANYCLPCAKEIPFLNKIWRETQTKDIIFLAVTKNTPLEVTRFAQRQKEMFSFSILPNAKELADVYDVNLVPTTIVINKEGEIVHRESGFSGNIDKLKQIVLEELEK
ncbi:TlpA disulfide reductase family protein [Bernardetia sp. ABR2-2B]|uniref:TlpA disulfide reductase family protein n=1 Tax=Bernardetia sp. ABR2-2B TaxID=3127472 RepID=UPI0030CD62A7